jgi:hypothetical protein
MEAKALDNGLLPPLEAALLASPENSSNKIYIQPAIKIMKPTNA